MLAARSEGSEMSWTEAQRRVKRDEYARLYASANLRNGSPIIVPENVERRDEHEPCFLCGQARGCKHRWAA